MTGIENKHQDKMSSGKFLTYIASHLNRDEAEISSIVASCSFKNVKKGSYLLQANEHCNHGFFVETGLLRQYSIDKKGKEHTISFVPEDWFVTDRDSVFFNRPSKYFIQAQEDSQVVLIDQNYEKLMSEKIPNFAEFNNRLLHNHISQLQERIDLLLGATAKERYLHFIKMYPDILLRVPQTMVASYLGITPEGLSRVRKDLALKNFKK
ncbi:Crp/Fnr family transcriptional regulator [Mariniflexile sp. AS56]|uniref:Crp/Fnr family transcriptional regulator n=1 Tax=Mariniflexile sp. AS56 TaxID=3063957 RepID=UPI0026EA7B2F|nr:Crp/Fnr family transcriptional regulator [Mariniflexile sp. AS56]MDO7173955.1 Crp/Fnr family transcriptional regulator [Mariniflexile sp. AS56]